MIRLIAALITAAASLGAIAADGTVWATAVSKHRSENRAIVFRFIQQFPPSFARSAYPDRVIIAWRYQSTHGMPSPEENAAMDRLEDLLSPTVENPAVAALVLVSTGGNLREWTYYAKSESVFAARLSEALRGQARFPIEIRAAPDPGWRTYEQFREGLKR